MSYSRLSLGFYEKNSFLGGIIGSIVNIFEFLKGTLAITDQAKTWLRAGDLEPMIRQIPQIQPQSLLQLVRLV